jgi:capsular exopolysaccharide synthesis family protein
MSVTTRASDAASARRGHRPADVSAADPIDAHASTMELAVVRSDPAILEVDELLSSLYVRTATAGTHVLAICSALTGEGRTTVSVGLAVAIAQDYPESRVLLVETDFGRPVLAEDFQVEPGPGLVDLLMGRQTIAAACRSTYLPNLDLLTAGTPTPNPGRWLRTSRMAAALRELRLSYDIVILDTPPVLTGSDALLVSNLADGAMLVVRAGVTPAALVRKTIEQLGEQKVRGVVLNGTRSSIPTWIRRLCGLQW